MRALQLDYQRAYKPVPWLGLGILVVALIGLAVMFGYHQTLNQQITFWERKVEHIERLSIHRALVSRPLTEQAARTQRLEVEQANQVVRQLGLPWNALFNAVETSGGQSIALLSLEPDLHKGTVKISGEAKDLNALLNYVKLLSMREEFGSVMLQNHQIRQDDPEKPVRFSLLGHWKETAP